MLSLGLSNLFVLASVERVVLRGYDTIYSGGPAWEVEKLKGGIHLLNGVRRDIHSGGS